MESKNHLLIDGDILLYQTVQACLQEAVWDDRFCTLFLDQVELKNLINDILRGWCEKFKTDEYTICLSDYNKPFRKELDETYKGQREGSKKPLGYAWAVEYIEQEFPYARYPSLEADDVMGILATNGTIKHSVIVSDDKDMRQIPGVLYVPRLKETIRIRPEDGERFHMLQILTGDRADNYPGCPGIGDKRGERALECCTQDNWWKMIVQTYNKAGRTAEDAVHQGRLSKILQAKDWDANKEEVILWNPPYEVANSVATKSSNPATPLRNSRSAPTSTPTSTDPTEKLISQTPLTRRGR